MRAVKTEYIRENTVFYVQNILHNIMWMYEDNDNKLEDVSFSGQNLIFLFRNYFDYWSGLHIHDSYQKISLNINE